MQTVANYGPYLKEWYTPGKINTLVGEEFPLFDLMNKRTDFGGKYWDCPVDFGDGAASSSDFARAQANSATAMLDELNVTFSKEYAFAKYSREALLSTNGKLKAYMEVSKRQADGAFRNFTRACAVSVFGDGTGTRAVVASAANSTINSVDVTTITVTDHRDLLKLHAGDVIEVYNGDTQYESTRKPILTINRNESSPSFTVAEYSTPPSAGYTICRDGDHNNVFKGLASWLPVSDPTPGESFYGLDRSQDRDLLAGIYTDVSGLGVTDAIMRSVRRTRTVGASRGQLIVVINDERHEQLNIEHENKCQTEMIESKTKGIIGHESFVVRAGGAKVNVISDPFCPFNIGYVLDPKTWTFASKGAAPKMVDEDGNPVLRDPNSDGFISRIAGYVSIGCTGIGKNGVFQWT